MSDYERNSGGYHGKGETDLRDFKEENDQLIDHLDIESHGEESVCYA